MQKRDKLLVGDVIFLDVNECESVGAVEPGEYVVTDAFEKGGWYVLAKRLDENGKYKALSHLINFHQCDGYKHVLKSAKVVRRMRRIFV